MELRRMREAAGQTAREAAALLGVNPVQMSQIESGRAGISEERLRRLAAHYVCGDADLIDALVDMATDRTRGWWEEFRGVLPPAFLDLSELEHHAKFLRIISVGHVPGLLQTPDYARAVFSFMVPPLPETELAPRVEHRRRRKAVLEARAEPITYEAVVHEAVLRIRVADRQVMKRQLEELLSCSEQPHVSLRVIPFDIDGFAAANCSMLYAGGPVPQLDTVQRDTPHGSGFVTAAAEVTRLVALFEKIGKSALGRRESRDAMLRVLRET
jgi:transcriptional regulator with XRE-family HTH domain